jgi:hypothetical protein
MTTADPTRRTAQPCVTTDPFNYVHYHHASPTAYVTAAHIVAEFTHWTATATQFL